MILNGLVASAALGESQNWQCIELMFTAAAAGTPWSLLSEQSGAAQKVRAVTGNGTVDLVTLAQAQALVASDAGTLRQVKQAELDAIAADLVTLLTNIPTAADGARSLVCAVGGLSGLGKVLCAEFSWAGIGTGGANSAVFVREVGPAVVATSATSVALSDGIIFWPAAGACVVAAAIPDVLDVPAAGAPVTVKIWVKP
jgi:hypothetical protein